MVANKPYENIAKFKYLVTILTHQNCIHEKLRNRLNSGNAYYNSVQSLLSSFLLSHKLKIKIYITIVFPVVSYVYVELGVSY
jgi:hypothetical protein